MRLPFSRSLRRRRRWETRSPLHVVLVGLVVTALLLALVVVTMNAPSGLPGRETTTMYASVPNPGNLQPHNEVRIAGVRVGQVLRPKAKEERAEIPIKLDPGTPALPVDTKPRVRARGLLGQRYLELIPGKSEKKLEEGDTIRGDETARSYGVPDSLDTFDRETRGAFGDMLGGLGTGLLGRGDELNSALHVAPPAGREFKRMIETVLARRGAARRFVPSLERGSAAFDAAREDIAQGFTAGADALQPFNDRSESLQNTIEEAPPTLSTAESGLEEGRRLLASARALSQAASETLPAAPPALRATTRLLRESRVPLRRATALLGTARSAIPATLRITRSLSPLLVPTKRALDDSIPIVRLAGRHGCAIDNFAENWRSSLGFGIPAPDGGAELPSGRIGGLQNFRITPVAGVTALQGFSRPPPKELAELNVYPEPCEYSPGQPFLGDPLESREGGR